ncbi:hypothetical protein GWI33_003508 [Rhynchophorus ferrugineus]|uniref:Uncharacterized protein n=1 Tax=Rhynchophorus ferrugineus TaxID=354439 RepID=A0A834HRI3_RHYFE|nr:hypothetical protein GWI33_003510 [Rhynchophorus ferrugineus]KAF7263200.1 hypothetical protein GWI33_003508 [Rhynchophorus ferrugineus]
MQTEPALYHFKCKMKRPGLPFYGNLFVNCEMFRRMGEKREAGNDEAGRSPRNKGERVAGAGGAPYNVYMHVI